MATSAKDFLRQGKSSGKREDLKELLEPRLSLLERLTDLISRPGRVTANIAEAALTGTSKPLEEAIESGSPISALKTLFAGKAPSEESRTIFSEALEAGGVPELGRLDLFKRTPEKASKLQEQFQTLQKSGSIPAGKGEFKPSEGTTLTGRGAIGFGLDVLADPLTYLTFGTGTGVKVGAKTLTKKTLKNLVKEVPGAAEQIGKELAEKGIKQSPEALLEAGRKRATRQLGKRITAGEQGLTDLGGLKFAGKTVIPGKSFKKASKTIGELTDMIPGVKRTKDFGRDVKSLFVRGGKLPVKAREYLDDYFTRVGAKTDKSVDEVIGAFKTDAGAIGKDGRVKIFRALAKAEDDSKELLANRLANIQGVKEEIQFFSKEAGPLISELKNVSREISRLDLNDLGKLPGIGDGRIKLLKESGIDDMEKLSALSSKELLKILNQKIPSIAKRIGKDTADNIIEQARKLGGFDNTIVNFEGALRKIIGIGPKREEFLRIAGIESLEQVAKLSPTELISALDKSAKGKGILRIAAKKELADKAKRTAISIIESRKKQFPILSKRQKEIKDRISKVIGSLEKTDISLDDLSLAKASANDFLESLKRTGIKREEFDKILTSRIKELPEELRGSARNISSLLSRAEKQDINAGLLKRVIPNYVPRKYIDLVDRPVTTGPGGAIVRTLGGRTRARKIGTLEDAQEFALKQGGKLEEDIAVPVAERLARGVKAREFQVLKQKLIKEYGELPRSIDNQLKTLSSRGVSDESTASVLKAFDKAQSIWKGSVTSLFPSFHFRNTVTNKFLGGLGAGADMFRPSTIKAGIQLKRGAKGTLDTIYGTKLDFDLIREQAQKNGVTKGFFGRDVVDSIERQVRKGFVKNPIDIGRSVGEIVEQTDRLTMYSALLRKGLDFKDAAKQVNRFMFDYGNLSPFEKTVMKRIFPFYTFKRKAMELFATELIKQPRVFNSLNDFKNFIQGRQLSVEEMSKLPEFLKERIVIDMNGKKITGLELGFEDAAATINRPEKIINEIDPIIKSVLELATNKDFFRDKDLQDAAFNITDIPPFLMKNPIAREILGLRIEKRPKYEDGKKVGTRDVFVAENAKILKMIRNLPTSRFLSTAALPSREGMTTGQSISKILTGIQSKEFDPGFLEFLKRKELEKKLKEKGVGKEFKRFYIPKDQKAGVPREVLRAIK